ncbi:MAG: HPP family protein [SAR86 cluster bacterium]|uniref:HPP family protein n=1 Tax=SAR86 cluster bacterium TaxID=2030880 RepID=A0A838Y0C7_9GAMM|nr:HPP family protein [SAR86 cluster bacterium]|tara:strand:+ start:181 stop:642 length:462 start_codon:yes stop_codon:yes gene_type:complete
MKNNLIAGFGGFLCIAVLSYLNSFDESNLWLIPPFGASMVLVMAVNESPLAHPKNVFFGHLISAFAGVLVFWILGYSAISLGLGVGLAIFLMMVTDTIHPPAGANPIIAILGAKGMSFIIMPVAIGAFFIVLFAVIYNKLLHRKYFSLEDFRN